MALTVGRSDKGARRKKEKENKTKTIIVANRRAAPKSDDNEKAFTDVANYPYFDSSDTRVTFDRVVKSPLDHHGQSTCAAANAACPDKNTQRVG